MKGRRPTPTNLIAMRSGKDKETRRQGDKEKSKKTQAASKALPTANPLQETGRIKARSATARPLPTAERRMRRNATASPPQRTGRIRHSSATASLRINLESAPTIKAKEPAPKPDKAICPTVPSNNPAMAETRKNRPAA